MKGVVMVILLFSSTSGCSSENLFDRGTSAGASSVRFDRGCYESADGGVTILAQVLDENGNGQNGVLLTWKLIPAIPGAPLESASTGRQLVDGIEAQGVAALRLVDLDNTSPVVVLALVEGIAPQSAELAAADGGACAAIGATPSEPIESDR